MPGGAAPFSPVLAGCRRAWSVTGIAVGHTVCVTLWRRGHFCNTRSHVWSSWLQLQIGVDVALFIFSATSFLCFALCVYSLNKPIKKRALFVNLCLQYQFCPCVQILCWTMYVYKWFGGVWFWFMLRFFLVIYGLHGSIWYISPQWGTADWN